MKKIKTNNLTKQIICIIIFLMLCNFIMPNITYAAGDDEKGGPIFDPIAKFVTYLCDSIMQYLQNTFTSNANIDNGDGTYNFQYSPGIIFSGKVLGLDINFIEPNTDVRNTNNFDAFMREKKSEYIIGAGASKCEQNQYNQNLNKARSHKDVKIIDDPRRMQRVPGEYADMYVDTIVFYYEENNKLIEAQRIEQRTNYDLEAIQEFGFCSGIENYACHLELRAPNSTPYTIFDYFNQNNDWLLIIDESHMTLPQIRGMYETDRSRKQTIVEYGFRLPSALDNRPLNYDEFLSKLDKVLFVSATPNDWEINYSNNEITEQIVRPTGLLDPEIFVRPTKYQMDDLLKELKLQKDNNERTLITVMTIRMAEELTHFLQQHNVKCTFLHNELKTLERSKIINNMRRGLYDAIIGINLLREGLDIPEVSLVVIFDADKPGFFRSEKSLIQIIGRAARNANGRVIMYGDEITNAMQIAIEKTSERRRIQMEYNQINNIIPQTIIKQIPSDITIINEKLTNHKRKKNSSDKISLDAVNENIAELEKQMLLAANEQNYELAAQYRDLILELKSKNQS